MIIQSLCLNVDNSYLSYKSSGNMDKTLVKVRLVEPSVKAHNEIPLEEMVLQEAKAFEDF
jgi:hypothetical protein